MNFKEWLLSKIEDNKNKEINSKNINTIIKTRLDKLSYLENISNLLLTNHNNLSLVDTDKLLDTISKYNSYKLNNEEISTLKRNTITNHELTNYEQILYTTLINQILISIKYVKEDINNLLKDKKILSTKYNNTDKYYLLLNKINNRKELIKENDILEEMLSDTRINSRDKLSNMEYILRYNESIIN